MPAELQADAENGYGTALRFLSDPDCAKHLTIKAVQDFRKQLGVLRTTLESSATTTEVKVDRMSRGTKTDELAIPQTAIKARAEADPHA